MQQAKAEGVLDRVSVVYADLGTAAWPGTKELVTAPAEQHGVPFYVVKERNKHGQEEELLDRVRKRGMWPDAANRWCTSEWKVGPISRVFTALVKVVRAAGWGSDPVRVLNVMGLRAEESKARALRAAFSRNARESNGCREVHDWLPVHHLSTEEIWAQIEEHDLPVHPAHRLGMPGLSCMFCVLASKSALVLSAQLNPKRAAEYAAVEAEIGHKLRKDLPWPKSSSWPSARRGSRTSMTGLTELPEPSPWYSCWRVSAAGSARTIDHHGAT